MHCDIQFDVELQKYVVRDHASQNGTLLNGQRISEVRQYVISFVHILIVATSAFQNTIYLQLCCTAYFTPKADNWGLVRIDT